MNWGVREVDECHRREGYLSCGYHYVIRRDGTVEPGRYRDDVGAHARGYNDRSVGICLIGGVTEKNVDKPENNFTEEQFTALKKLVADLLTVYPGCEVIGHRDVANKACPSFDAKVWWAKESATL
jgi:N-acetylmuramoyl-L-alanine amidase